MANENPKIDINIVQILNVATNILQTSFLTGPRANAKQEFIKLKQGKSIKVATLNVGQLKDARLSCSWTTANIWAQGLGLIALLRPYNPCCATPKTP